MFGGQHQLGSWITGGEHVAAHGRERWCHRDPTRHSWLDHVESHDGSERIAGHPDVVVQTREKIDRGGHVEAFGFATVVLT